MFTWKTQEGSDWTGGADVMHLRLSPPLAGPDGSGGTGGTESF